MLLLIIATLMACPLLSSGIMPERHMADPTVPWSFRAYVQNPSPFPIDVGSVEIVMRKPDAPESSCCYAVPVQIRPVKIPPGQGMSIDLGEQPGLDPHFLAGEHAECVNE